MIIIPEGATSEDVSQLLYDEGIISSPKCFQLFSRLRNDADNYLAGEHFVSPNMAYETIIKTLTTYEDEEQKEAVTITFIEGVNIFDAADQLQDQGICNAAEFLYAFNAGGFGFDFEKEPFSEVAVEWVAEYDRLVPEAGLCPGVREATGLLDERPADSTARPRDESRLPLKHCPPCSSQSIS